MIDEKEISYPQPMLPNVDYIKFQKNFSFSLVDLEHGIMEDCSDFLQKLKSALIEEHLIQVPELLVAHLCAYLGTAATVHTVHQAEELEPIVIDLIKHQAHAAYQHFKQYPINNTIESIDQKKKNLENLRNTTPGSIIVQTMRLKRVMMDILDELVENRQSYFKSHQPPEQTELMCSEEMLIKIMLLTSSIKCAEWRKQLRGLSDHYVINQLAIQIGWLIGYFSHLNNQEPDETQYFEYGLPVFSLYRKYIFKYMESYATAKFEQEASEEPSEAEMLLGEIRVLSEKTHAQLRPPFNDFQKQISIVQAGIEKLLIALIIEGMAIKVILMSVFYFWFTLDAPLRVEDPTVFDEYSPFDEMGNIIDLVKSTVCALPEPKLSSELKLLNAKMQAFKSNLPDPASHDEVDQDTVAYQSNKVNMAIHTLTSDYLKQDYHVEVIANVLFSQWMHLSVFYGVSESDWQKMDYYLVEILTAVRNYIPTIIKR